MVFLDESGFSLSPNLRRTWSPRGQTPILRERLRSERISAIAALGFKPMTRRAGPFDRLRASLLLRLEKGSVKTPQVIQFLRHLRRHVRGKAVLLWDHLSSHRSVATEQYLASQRHWLKVEWFPSYAPELNPVEYFWSYLHATQLANFTPDHLLSLADEITKATRHTCRRPDLALAFLKQSTLFTDADFGLSCEPQY